MSPRVTAHVLFAVVLVLAAIGYLRSTRRSE
jgi:hypothetical protein